METKQMKPHQFAALLKAAKAVQAVRPTLAALRLTTKANQQTVPQRLYV